MPTLRASTAGSNSAAFIVGGGGEGMGKRTGKEGGRPFQAVANCVKSCKFSSLTLRLAPELIVGPVGQAVRLQVDWWAIFAGGIAFHSSRMSADLCKLILPEIKFNRSTINVFAVHIPRSLGACGAFFGPFISTVDINGTELTE